MQLEAPRSKLPAIPLVEVGPDFAYETLELEFDRAQQLFDAATHRLPRFVLTSLDGVSRRWLERWDHAHLAEIDRIAARVGRPGAYFLSVNYEWGCTCRVGPSPDGSTARLVRVLDWATPGLGRHIMAARVNAKAGPFYCMTWPGYTGVIQGMAPGRFSGALNQAPIRRTTGVVPADWAAARARVWQSPHPTAAHVMREVFETARNFADAKRMLETRPIAAPAIFSIAGMKAGETAVIERREHEAHVHAGPTTAANHWQAPGWHGTPRGSDSAGRARNMHAVVPDLDPGFAWLAPPILNARTRLVMMADAAAGRMVAQGWEADGPATAPIEIAA